jgi:hypothetical protein
MTFSSNRNSLNLFERNGISGAVVELGRPRRGLGGNPLGLFERAAIFEVGGDAGGAEGVAADGRGEPGGQGALLDHAQHIILVKRVQSQHAIPPEGRNSGSLGQSASRTSRQTG